MSFSPIALFAYNRPSHTKKALDAIALNLEAKESELFIFCDGPKSNANLDIINRINRVVEIAQAENRFKQVNVFVKDENFGLSKSIILGVSQIVEQYGKVIVLEDDIVVGNYFLKFINKGLELYDGEKEVYGVTGYGFPSSKKISDTTYFLPIMSSWGYATWADRWKKINFNGAELLRIVKEKGLQLELDFGYLNYSQMLKDQVQGKNDSWAIRFYVSMFLEKGVFLFPNKSLLKNIGLDGSGVHCLNSNNSEKQDSYSSKMDIEIVKKPVCIKNRNIKIIKRGNLKNSQILMNTLKKKIRKTIAPEVIQLIKRKINFKQNKELERLKRMPRYIKTNTILFGKKIEVPDSASYTFMYKEIFEENIYKFKTKNSKPYIIDGGANIGLSTIYFKLLFPESNIVSFEPDLKIFNYLKVNIEAFGFKNIDLLNKGIWKENTKLLFNSEGADGGLISEIAKDKESSEFVQVVSLNPFLEQPVDFLKLDIEGAETIVLKDIANNLKNVERIFVEYHSMVGQPQTLNEVIEILTKANFRLYMSIPGNNSIKSPLMGLKKYNNMDLQLNIFGYKEKHFSP
jgi:FkbM family methyltransferase